MPIKALIDYLITNFLPLKNSQKIRTVSAFANWFSKTIKTLKLQEKKTKKNR